MLESRALANRASLEQAQAAIGQRLAHGTEGPVPVYPTETGEEISKIISETTRGRWGDAQVALRKLAESSLPKTWFRTKSLSRETLPETDEELIEARSRAIEDGLRAGLPKDVVEVEIKRVACMVCESPSLLVSLPQTDAHLKEFPVSVVRAGRSVVREIGPGIVVVDPKKLQLVSPPTWRDGFVSPSAIMLAQSNTKPEMAMVRDKQKVRHIFSEIGEGGTSSVEKKDNARARVQLEKASRFLERRRWIDWYHRREKAYGRSA